MRRIIAAVAALAMIGGGFAVWNARRSGSPTGGTPGDGGTARTGSVRVVWCVPEAADACGKLPGTVSGVTAVAILTPAQIEQKLVKAGKASGDIGVDAIVATRHWLDRWAAITFGLKVDTTPVASTELVAVERAVGLGCAGHLRCLLKRGARLSLPQLGATSTGTIAAALALRAEGATSLADDLDPKVLAAVKAVEQSLATPRTATEGLRDLLQVSLLDAVVMTRADAEAANLAKANIAALRPAAHVTLHVAVFGTAKPAPLHTGLATLLRADRWSAPVADTDAPDAEFLNQTYDLPR